MEAQEQKYPKKIRRNPWPKIDFGKWLMEIQVLEQKIRDQKKVMRASGHNISASELSALLALKREATRMYMIRAASRGRLHLRSNAVQQQQKEIEEGLKTFSKAA